MFSSSATSAFISGDKQDYRTYAKIVNNQSHVLQILLEILIVIIIGTFPCSYSAIAVICTFFSFLSGIEY